jgi:biotin synthase
MCYAIPGKVVAVDNNRVVVDYFGERKHARSDLLEVSPGDYIYAQGGFVINKVSPQAAQETLKLWKEIFFKLKATDLRLSRPGKTLYQTANVLRQKHLGNSCCVHGSIEFSNYCRNDCLYCGIRSLNAKVKRYRLSVEEIVSAADHAVNHLGFKSLVLQSGEDLFYTEEKLIQIVSAIKQTCAALLFISIGERELKTYEKLYQAGVRGALLRFETSNASLYREMRPGHDLKDRLHLIHELSALGYLIITGALIGLPGQSEADSIEDLRLTKELKAEMYSFGPILPHPATPLRNSPPPLLEAALNTIARARILDPDAKIVVTTALETLHPEGARQGLLAGANSLMINVTPEGYRDLYEIYPHRYGIDSSVEEQIKKTVALLSALGRAPTDLGV